MLERDEISREVLALVEEFKSARGYGSEKDINGGGCYSFAEQLTKRLRDGAEQWEGPGHAFVKCSGLFFDSETPEGVEDWRDLGSFVRWGYVEGEAWPKKRKEEEP